MNRERIGKLLTLRDSGANSTLATGEKTKQFRAVRPDGGVVTQRTANPLSLADFRDTSHNSPSVPRIAFQGLSAPSANAAQAMVAEWRRQRRLAPALPTSAVPQGCARKLSSSPCAGEMVMWSASI
jgi:hypothetical protein